MSPELISKLRATVQAKDFLKPKVGDPDYGSLDLDGIPEPEHKKARAEWETQVVNTRVTGLMATAMRGYRDPVGYRPY